MAAATHVALLRGVNVGGNRKVPMAELRALAEGLGWADVRTYVQSGNVVFRARGAAGGLERALEQAIEGHFGFAVPVVVRSAATWREHAVGGPFPAAAQQRPKLLHLALAKGPLPRAVVAGLQPYCKDGEQVAVQGEALWIDFVGGVARSKLTSAVLDRVCGAVVTARNLLTVQALAALLDGTAD